MNGNIIAELARVTVEEVFNEDLYEALEELLAEEDGFYPTPEETEAERDAACYGQDDRVLCIDELDMTDCGQVIPEWAFY
jgi:predicted ATPase